MQETPTRPSAADAYLRDPDRLAALYEAELLDGTSNEAFDRLTRLAQRFLEVPVGMVNLVDADRQVTTSSVDTDGTFRPGQEVPLRHSFCRYAVATREPLVVDDARKDPRVRDNPAVEAGEIVAYLGVPLITEEGHALGSLCVIDRRPRRWTESEIDTVSDLADAASTEIGLRTEIRRRRLLESELESRVRKRTAALEAAQNEILSRLAAAAEYRDDETGRHTRRVGAVAELLAELLGRPDEWAAMLGRAAPLHDVGKVGMPDRILLKEGPLDDDEFELMKRHTVIGGRLLADGRSELVRLAETVARTHHERWDGGGYPRGLPGGEIPVAGRIVAVADAFDAMIHDRPYRPALSLSEALAEIRRQRGRQFAPDVADALLGNTDAVLSRLDLSAPSRGESRANGAGRRGEGLRVIA